MKPIYVLIGMILFVGIVYAVDSNVQLGNSAAAVFIDGALGTIIPSADTGGVVIELGGPGEPYSVQPCKPLEAYVTNGNTGEIVWPEDLSEYCTSPGNQVEYVSKSQQIAHRAAEYFTGDETPGAEAVALGVHATKTPSPEVIAMAHRAALLFTGNETPGAAAVASAVVL